MVCFSRKHAKCVISTFENSRISYFIYTSTVFMLFLTHCQKKTFHSFWKLHTAQQQGTHFDTDRSAGKGYTLHPPWCSGSEMKHQSPACCRFEMCWPEGISPFLQGLSNIVICHSRHVESRQQSTHMLHTFHHHLCLHTPQTLWVLPLTQHTCHFTHLATSPSHSGSLFLLPLQKGILSLML